MRTIYSSINTSDGYLIASFNRDITEKKDLNIKLNNQMIEMNERVKELNILYDISSIVCQNDLTIDDIFLKTAKILRNSFKYPETACIKIKYYDKEFKNKNFIPTKWKIKDDIFIMGKIAGSLEIYYSEKKPKADVGPFLFEELRILKAVNERLKIIVEQKLMQDALKISEEKYRTIIENTKDIIYSCSLEGTIEFISPHLNWFGYKIEDILGKSIFDLVYFEDLEIIKNNLAETLKTNKGITTVFRLKGKDGSLNWIEESGGPVKIGNEIKILGTLRNINERKKIDEELKIAKNVSEKANKAKTDFIANISHEIRTPMNSIIGIDNLLLETSLNEEQKNFAEIIKRSAESLLGILNNLIDISKIEKGKIDLEYSKFNLRMLIKDSIDIFKFDTLKKNIKISGTIGKEIPEYLFSDAGKIKQILINLISNSVKFTKEGSIKIAVSMLKQDNKEITLKFIITDTGIGISEKNLKKLFIPYSQIDSSTTRSHRGVGLGLSISKLLVEALGGEIGVSSRENQGSTFWFKIGFKKIKSKSLLKESKNSYKTDNVKNIQILLADDDEINHMIIMNFLKKTGYKCDVVTNGLEVLEALKKKKYSLILIDIQMPDMDGYETSIKIRNSSSFRDIPIIALTASALRSEEKKCYESGMNDYLTKPVDRIKLLNLIKKWTEFPN